MDPAELFGQVIGGTDPLTDLDGAATLIGLAFDPAVSVESVGELLDELAARCDPTFSGIVEGLFGSGLLRGNREQYDDPRNSYLHSVIARGVGIPISLSVIAMGVGRRLSCSIAGVGNPGHFLIGDPVTRRVADPFNRGITVASPPWVPQPARATLIRMLNNLQAIHVRNGDAVALHTLARLRSPFDELEGERDERRRWVRHFN